MTEPLTSTEVAEIERQVAIKCEAETCACAFSGLLRGVTFIHPSDPRRAMLSGMLTNDGWPIIVWLIVGLLLLVSAPESDHASMDHSYYWP